MIYIAFLFELQTLREDGIYTQQEIQYILATAFTGFSTAKVESHFESEQEPFVIIHTGFWGCGAYGGNRILMALLQLLAARLASVNRLVFHTGVSTTGERDFVTAQCILNENLAPLGSNIEVSALIAQIQALEFQWGIGDGN